MTLQGLAFLHFTAGVSIHASCCRDSLHAPHCREQPSCIKLQGLAFMHANSRLHQSIGPGSVIINKTDERELRVMQARLRDLAFAVDISNEAMVGGATLAEIWDQGTIAKSDPKCVVLTSRACCCACDAHCPIARRWLMSCAVRWILT